MNERIIEQCDRRFAKHWEWHVYRSIPFYEPEETHNVSTMWSIVIVEFYGSSSSNLTILITTVIVVISLHSVNLKENLYKRHKSSEGPNGKSLKRMKILIYAFELYSFWVKLAKTNVCY